MGSGDKQSHRKPTAPLMPPRRLARNVALEPVILAGTTVPAVAADLARELGCSTAEADIRRFPDGECYVHVTEDLTGRHAIIVQNTSPDAELVEALLLQDAAREAGAARVTTVVPYLAYARQDRSFKPGEAVSSRAVARALGANTDDLITVDPHKEEILSFYPHATSVSAVPQLAAKLGEWGVDAVLAPDRGARDRAQRAAAILGVPHDHLEKTRLGPTEVVIKAKDLDVAGKRVAIVDDLIASGGTMIKAAQQLKEQGATAVYAACTHGLFTGGAVPKLLAGGIDRVLCTDSLPSSGCDTVSLAPAVAGALLTTATA